MIQEYIVVIQEDIWSDVSENVLEVRGVLFLAHIDVLVHFWQFLLQIDILKYILEEAGVLSGA